MIFQKFLLILPYKQIKQDMKRFKLSLVLLVAALCTGLSAQARFGFGPKLGMNFSEFRMSGDVLDSSNRCGFTGGVTAEYIAPALNLGFDISLMYAYQRTNVQVTDEDGVSYGKNVHGNFFEIPLHLKYVLNLPALSSVFAPYFFTGPSVAFKLGGQDSYFDTKKTQWGWDLGLGIQLIRKLQIGAGYTWGINKLASIVAADYVGNTGHEIKVKNNYWTVTAAWMF